MNYSVLFHKRAEIELLESQKWYAERSLKANEKFIEEILYSINLIKRNPLLFPIVFDNKRKINLKNFPFSVIYSIHNHKIFVISVFHHSRNPGIWRQQ